MNITKGDFFILRSPLLPFASTIPSIESLCKNKLFLEAIYLASPELWNIIQRYLTGGFTPEEIKRLRKTLVKYYLRMSFRSTPFGIMAGISKGTWGEATEMILQPHNNYRQSVRIDMGYLGTICNSVMKNPRKLQNIIYYPNDTIYRTAGYLRFFEYQMRGIRRSYKLSKVERDIYVDRVLTAAQSGATFQDLVKSLVDDEIDVDTASDFVEEIIGSKILISSLEPSVTGIPYFDQLKAASLPIEISDHLKQLDQKLQVINQAKVGDCLPLYEEIQRNIEPDPNTNLKQSVIQVDLYKPTRTCTLNSAHIVEIERAVKFLGNLNAPINVDTVNSFRDEFAKRYEAEEISLAIALDPDTGIGFPVGSNTQSENIALLDGINLWIPGSPGKIPYSPWTNVLSKKYLESLKTGVLELKEEDFRDFYENKNPVFPDSMYSIVQVLQSTSKNGDREEYLYHRLSSGPTAANLIGRFTQLDPTLEGELVSLLKKEQSFFPNASVAEIVHLPQARVGNIVTRSVFRDYEIPIATRGGVDQEHTIPLSDLMISVVNDKIVLRSKKLNREIIPRLSNAHNYVTDALPLYQFLCCLQLQEYNVATAWNWGPFREFNYLPRVVIGKVILSKARWIIRKADITAEKLTIQALREFLNREKIPAVVCISEADNVLPIFTTDDICCEILLDEIKRNGAVSVEECLFNDQNLVVTNSEGSFTNELIVPLNIDNKRIVNRNVQKKLSSKPKRTFSPGSEWIYLKIYSGTKTVENIFIEKIFPWLTAELNQGTLDKWFFLRYLDPEYHIRLRIFSTKPDRMQLINRLHDVLSEEIEQETIWKIQIDTYKKEIERYGVTTIDDSEAIFWHDSTAVAEILTALKDSPEEVRWHVATRGIDEMLNDFKFSLKEKIAIMEDMNRSFQAEFNATTPTGRHQLSAKYRTHRMKLIQLLSENIQDGFTEIFDKRSNGYSKNISAIKSSKENQIRLIRSYVHMFINRLFRSRQRQIELILYDMLHQHYKSQLARESKHVPKQHAT